MENKPIFIIIADEHQMNMDALKFYLEVTGDYKVTALVKNESELFDILDNTKCDILLLGNNIPEMNGFGTIEKISKKFPEIKIISIKLNCDEKNINETIKAGAKCCISKSNNLMELNRSIRMILDGEHYFPQKEMICIENKMKGEQNEINLSQQVCL